jgi:ATP-dependent helicase/nuclease subunit A
MSSRTSELVFSYPNQFIRAGAGAGKTTQLISTFIDFVQKFKHVHGRYPKVILTTFTRKSTQEIKERLLTQALKINDENLFSYINKKSNVHISTIHGVLGLFLNQYHDVIGLSTDFKVLDNEQIRKQSFKQLKMIFKKKTQFMELLEHYTFNDLLLHLDRAVDFSKQNQKTDFIKDTDLKDLRHKEFNRIIALIETLTELPTPAGKGWGEYFQILGNISNALKAEDLNLALEIAAQLPNKPRFSKDKPPFDTDLHDELVKYISDQKAVLYDLDTDHFIAENHRMNSLFFDLINLFSAAVKESRSLRNEITISDLETLCLEIIRTSNVSAIEFSKQFDYFMVDEFQDTSPTQVSILTELIGDRPHFIVGDPQQSIYLFRGARSEVFLNKQEEAKNGDYENIRLNTNYRSRPSLMKFINHFFNRFSNAFEPMIPKEIAQSSDSAFSDGYYIETADQIQSALNQIQKLISLGAKASDICVLSKKNSILMSLSQAAGTYGIPVQLMVAAGFDERREVLDLVSFVKFLVNPYDTQNLIQLLRSPWFKISDNEIVDLRKDQNKNYFWNQLKSEKLPDAICLEEYLNQFSRAGILQTTISFVNRSGILASAQYLDSSGKKEANIWKFIQSLRDQVNHKSFDLNEYLSNQFSSLQSDLASNLSEAQPVMSPDRVNLMTIHNAKGLQFEHVIVLGLKDQPNTTNVMPFSKEESTGLFNLGIFNIDDSQIHNSFWGRKIRKQFNLREHAESERLLYVAVTRAKTSVTLIAEDKKINSKSTWYAKSQWPAVGVYKDSDYSFESLRDDEQPALMFESAQQGDHIISPYRILDETLSDTESVTEKISKQKNSDSDQISNHFIQNLDKAKRGTDLHKLFESLKYNEASDIQKITSDKNKKYLDFLTQQTELPLRSILDSGFVEWGFGLEYNGQLISGQIDAWGIVDGTVYILDYKTGSPQYFESAYEQLSFYATCLKEMRKINENQKIILGIIYPVDEKILKKSVSFNDLKLT